MVTKTRKRCPTGQHKDKKTGKCIGTRKNISYNIFIYSQ